MRCWKECSRSGYRSLKVSVRITPTMRPPDAVNLPLLSRMLSHSRAHTLTNMPMIDVTTKRRDYDLCIHCELKIILRCQYTKINAVESNTSERRELTSWSRNTRWTIHGRRVVASAAGEQLHPREVKRHRHLCVATNRGTTLRTHTGGSRSWNLQQ
jgi:hypothetical protein